METKIKKLFDDNFDFAFKAATYNNMRVAISAFYMVFYMADNNGLQGVLFRYSSKIYIKYIEMRKNRI